MSADRDRANRLVVEWRTVRAEGTHMTPLGLGELAGRIERAFGEVRAEAGERAAQAGAEAALLAAEIVLRRLGHREAAASVRRALDGMIADVRAAEVTP